MSMMKSIAALAALASVTAGISAGAADAAVRSLVLTPGKGVSFFMGSKHGVTLFTADQGFCNLTVTLAENADMTSMSPGSASRIQMAVIPGKPARVETAEGQALVFACNADGQSMNLDMPPDFKFVPKG